MGELTQTGAPRMPKQLSNLPGNQLWSSCCHTALPPPLPREWDMAPCSTHQPPDLIHWVCVSVIGQTCAPEQRVLGTAHVPPQHLTTVQPPYEDKQDLISSATPAFQPM